MSAKRNWRTSVVLAASFLGGAALGGGANVAVAAPPAESSPTAAPHMCRSRYAGPCFEGQPDLALTASLVAAGGGAERFSADKALAAMVGEKVARAEVAKLTRQYGLHKVGRWFDVFNFVVRDAVQIATKAGIKVPRGKLKGKALAAALVKTGTVDQTFYIEFLLDKLVSHRIHEKVMDDIDDLFGPTANANYHRISNQAMYDLAHALGARHVKLCAFH